MPSPKTGFRVKPSFTKRFVPRSCLVCDSTKPGSVVAGAIPPSNYTQAYESSVRLCHVAVTSKDAATTFINAGTQKQAFAETHAHRDDWLHRGDLLADVDYYHYSRYFERIEQPRSGTAQSFQKHHGRYFLFDSHYALARTYVQVLRRKPKTVQNVGPQCQRSDVNNGEDNSAYKAFFHSCVRCTGAGQCAHPLIYQPLLYPRVENIDKTLAEIARDPRKRRHTVCFAPAWRARQSEIKMLAQRGQEKQDKARRIGVIQDTTLFKEVYPSKPSSDEGSKDDRELEPNTKLCQILVQQAIRAATRGCGYLEPIIEITLRHLGRPVPWHPDQPHLAEWQACSAREILHYLDGSIDARNVAQKQAAKHRSTLACDADAEHDVSGKTKMWQCAIDACSSRQRRRPSRGVVS